MTAEHITRLLTKWQKGDEQALSNLMPLVYSELRIIASKNLNQERANHTLNTTALVNEVYMKLVDQNRVDWKNRVQFFAVAAQLMRRILVDHAREISAKKRGNGMAKISLEPHHEVSREKEVNVELLEDALKDLETFDATQCRLVEMRYFAGLTLQEVAEILDITLARAKREWQMAKAWLYQYIQSKSAEPI